MGMMMNYMMAMGSFDQKKFSTKPNLLAGHPVLGDGAARASRGPSQFVRQCSRPSTRHHRLVWFAVRRGQKVPGHSRSRAVFAAGLQCTSPPSHCAFTSTFTCMYNAVRPGNSGCRRCSLALRSVIRSGAGSSSCTVQSRVGKCLELEARHGDGNHSSLPHCEHHSLL